MRPTRLTPDTCATATRLLTRRDPALARLVRAHGPCTLGTRVYGDSFSALVRAIIFQQLATAAAQTIHARTMAVLDRRADGRPRRPRTSPPPEVWLSTPDEELRAAGLSTQKLRYIQDLCRHVTDGTLDTRNLHRLHDEDVIATLTQVKGIGRWTAEMFLMFHLGRPDVLPVGDLGVATGFGRVYGDGTKFTAQAMTERAELWRPYRSIGSWYMWRALEGGNW